MIELKHVTKKYRNKTALEDVSLCFPQGEIVGLFGENGAGKTTLMKSILGFLKYSGEITLDGEKIDWRNIGRIAFATSEHSFFPAMDAEGHKAFYQEHFGTFKEKRFDALMEFFELPANRAIGKFSTGQKNQFEVLLALSQGADYILMDEPFAGNDIFNREDFYKVLLGLLEPSETVILSTHILDDVAQTCPYVCVLRSGRLRYDGATAGLIDGAHGRTWLTPPLMAPPTGAVVVNAATTTQGTRYRIVSAAPPVGSQPVEPTLEDGYMALASDDRARA